MATSQGKIQGMELSSEEIAQILRRNRPWPAALVKLVQFAMRDHKAARRLVRERPEVLTMRTGLGETALHYLAVENYAAAVELLIELGAEVDVRNDRGESALAEAIQVGAKEAARMLRRAGARR